MFTHKITAYKTPYRKCYLQTETSCLFVLIYVVVCAYSKLCFLHFVVVWCGDRVFFYSNVLDVLTSFFLFR